MPTRSVKRGEIYFAKLDPTVGRETGKTRPVLVIQNDIGNTYSPTTTVAVITKYSKKKASYPICAAVPRSEGLKKDSIVNLSQIRTIDKRRLQGPELTRLSGPLMQEIDQALRLSLAL